MGWPSHKQIQITKMQNLRNLFGVDGDCKREFKNQNAKSKIVEPLRGDYMSRNGGCNSYSAQVPRGLFRVVGN